MAIASLRQTVLQTINEVERLLNVTTSSTLTTFTLTRVLLRLLNGVIDELSDLGDWQELYDEVNVTASSSVESYTIEASASALIQRVEEISFNGNTQSMNVTTPEDIRRLQRLRSFGVPRKFALVGVNASSGAPIFRPWPIPGSSQNNQVFQVVYYKKQGLLTTSDSSTVIAFPANVVIQGLYAAALLEENGGEPSREFETEYAKYVRMRGEAQRRFNADTGNNVTVVPTGGWGR